MIVLCVWPERLGDGLQIRYMQVRFLSRTPQEFGDWVCSEWTPALQAGNRSVRIRYSPPKFRLVHIMAIIADCLSVDGSSILPRVAKLRGKESKRRMGKSVATDWIPHLPQL